MVQIFSKGINAFLGIFDLKWDYMIGRNVSVKIFGTSMQHFF